MSWQALNWAAKQKCGSPITKSVLLVLANYSSEDGYCYPSVQRLMEITELSRRAVLKHLSVLEERGLIKTEARRRANGTQNTNGFWLLWEAEIEVEKTPNRVHVVHPDRVHVVHPVTPVEKIENLNNNNQIEQKNENQQGARGAPYTLNTEPSENLNLVEDRKKPIFDKLKKSMQKKLSGVEVPDCDLARWMHGLIASRYPVDSPPRPPNFDSWAQTIRLLRERDGRSLAQIRSLFEWVQADEFWSRNVLCPAALRRQWDRLVLQRESSQHDAHNARASPAERKPKCCLCQRDGYYRHEYDWYCREHEREWSEAN